jgi:hypothetical protein
MNIRGKEEYIKGDVIKPLLSFDKRNAGVTVMLLKTPTNYSEATVIHLTGPHKGMVLDYYNTYNCVLVKPSNGFVFNTPLKDFSL